MPAISEFACSTATKTWARPSSRVTVWVMSVPHISLTLSVTMVPSCAFSWLRPTRWGREQAVLSHYPAHAAGARANATNTQSRPYFAIAFAVKVGRFDFSADMIGQVSIRTRACRTGATKDRERTCPLEKAIDAGARNIPNARDPRQAIRARQGGRDRLAHRLDLLRTKGRLPSMAAILPYSNSLSMVISPTLDFSRAISSSRSSRSRSFRADAAPASARSRHSVSLATETFASRATKSNGSPRNKRATTAILRWTE